MIDLDIELYILLQSKRIFPLNFDVNHDILRTKIKTICFHR